jgi:hypothetical protein
VWLGLAEAGLARWREGRFTALTAADGLPQHPVSALHVDGHGRLWVGTLGGGLVRIDDTRSDIRESLRPGGRSRQPGHPHNRGRLGAHVAQHADRSSRTETGPSSTTQRPAVWPQRDTIALRDGAGIVVRHHRRVSRIQPGWRRLNRCAHRWAPAGFSGRWRIGPCGSPPASQLHFFALTSSRAALRYQYRLEGGDPGWSHDISGVRGGLAETDCW